MLYRSAYKLVVWYDGDLCYGMFRIEVCSSYIFRYFQYLVWKDVISLTEDVISLTYELNMYYLLPKEEHASNSNSSTYYQKKSIQELYSLLPTEEYANYSKNYNLKCHMLIMAIEYNVTKME